MTCSCCGEYIDTGNVAEMEKTVTGVKKDGSIIRLCGTCLLALWQNRGPKQEDYEDVNG